MVLGRKVLFLIIFFVTVFMDKVTTRSMPFVCGGYSRGPHRSRLQYIKPNRFGCQKVDSSEIMIIICYASQSLDCVF